MKKWRAQIEGSFLYQKTSWVRVQVVTGELTHLVQIVGGSIKLKVSLQLRSQTSLSMKSYLTTYQRKKHVAFQHWVRSLLLEQKDAVSRAGHAKLMRFAVASFRPSAPT